MISCIFWKSICILYNILTEICHLQDTVFNVNYYFCCYVIIFSPFAKAQQYLNTNIYNFLKHNPNCSLPIQSLPILPLDSRT